MHILNFDKKECSEVRTV